MPNRADAVAGRPAVAAPGFAGLLESWRQVVLNGNLAPGRRVDAVSRWLLITRACVFPMTLTSGAIGGLLAALSAPAPHWGYFALALLGLVIAHAANNMINDYFDTIGGIDTEAYVRTQYAPHPLFSGLVTKRGLLATIAACNLADLAIGIVLLRAWGWPVAAFALAGLFVSVFYVAPPLKLKHHGPHRQAHRQVRAGRGARYPHTAGAARQERLAPPEPGPHGRVLRRRRRPRRQRQGRRRRAPRRRRHPAAAPGAEGVRRTQAGRPAARLPRLAAVVRFARLVPRPPGGRALRPRPRPERAARSVDLTSAAVRGRAARRCSAAPRSCRPRSSSSGRRGTAWPSGRRARGEGRP